MGVSLQDSPGQKWLHRTCPGNHFNEWLSNIRTHRRRHCRIRLDIFPARVSCITLQAQLGIRWRHNRGPPHSGRFHWLFSVSFSHKALNCYIDFSNGRHQAGSVYLSDSAFVSCLHDPLWLSFPWCPFRPASVRFTVSSVRNFSSGFGTEQDFFYDTLYSSFYSTFLLVFGRLFMSHACNGSSVCPAYSFYWAHINQLRLVLITDHYGMETW